jgi:hypothetical protein
LFNLLRPLLIVAVVAAVGYQYLAWSGRLAPVPKASVSAARLDVAADGSSAEVVLRVTAGAEDLGPLSVFWLVSLPDTPRAWETPRYAAPAQTLDMLAAGSTAELTWRDTRLTLPIGRYDVTGWVHESVASSRDEHLAGGLVGSFPITRAAPGSLTFDEGWFSQASGPLVLQSLAVADDAPQTQTVSVDATVLNRGTQPVAGQAFWLVSRFTDAEPYRAPFWRSDWLDIPTLAPGESRVMSWTRSIGLSAGTYGLSVWVHADGPTGSEHSHSSLNIPLVLAPPAAHVLRTAPAGSVQVASGSIPQRGLARLVLDNQSSDSDVSVAAEIMPEIRRYDWYTVGSRPGGPLIDVALPSHSQRTIDVPVDIDCGPDNALVRVLLFMRGQPAETAAPVDDVLVDACP